jgi:hypothetical protein
VVDAFKKADPEHDVFTCLRLQVRCGVTTLSCFTEGYVPRKIYGRVGVMSSVGGDYNIAYKETEDKVVEERKFLSVAVEFLADGKIRILLHEGNIDEAKVLFSGRGFGRKGASVIADVKKKFAYHQSRYV